MEPGIYFDMPWDEYRAIPYPSQSLLKHGMRSMKRIRRAKNGELAPSVKTTAVGQYVHCAISGEMDRIAVMPRFELDEQNVVNVKQKPKTYLKADGSVSAAGKRWDELCKKHGHPAGYDGKIGQKSTSKNTEFYQSAKEAWEREQAGKDIVTELDMQTARKVLAEISANKVARDLIDKAQQEVVVIGEIAGVMCKTRVDGYVDGERTGWDLKTTDDIEPHKFYRHAKKMGYFFQFALQQLLFRSIGLEMQEYFIIGAEVQGDFDTALIPVPDQLIIDWETKVIRVVEQYRIAEKQNVWDGLFPSGHGYLEVPEYQRPFMS